MAARMRFKGFSTVDLTTKTGWTLYDIELIKRDLLNEFMTKKGDRLMMPNFGTIIWDKLFESNTESNQAAIIADVTRIVNADPRCEVANVSYSTTDYGITVYIDLLYKPWQAFGSFEVDFDTRSAEF
jgi:phage baseplate assembly protein W